MKLFWKYPEYNKFKFNLTCQSFKSLTQNKIQSSINII